MMSQSQRAPTLRSIGSLHTQWVHIVLPLSDVQEGGEYKLSIEKIWSNRLSFMFIFLNE